MKKEEEANFWVLGKMPGFHGALDTKEPVGSFDEDEYILDFGRATKRQRGLIIVGLAVMWLIGEAGCYLAGLALHETAHIF